MARRRFRLLAVAAALAASLVAGCNTRYDFSDPYTMGLRDYDRGWVDLAAGVWGDMAAKGDCDAKARYAHIVFAGKSHPELFSPGRLDNTDQKQAVHMLSEAADGGQPYAILMLASLYAYGASPPAGILPAAKCIDCEIPIDPVAGYRWFNIGLRFAKYEGQRNFASSSIAKLRVKLSEEDRTKADAEAATWSPSDKSCKPRDLM